MTKKIGRPKSNNEPFIFRMPKEMHRQVRAQAALEGMNTSAFLRRLIREFIDSQPEYTQKAIKDVKRKAVKS